ncbi:hypothetical protein NCCP2222_33580 [Sporosarcina sp. NCCP-2222]|nr:hypothetical protein NCCP2222_33580 [Sporosarcina sp. NCCP-2222]
MNFTIEGLTVSNAAVKQSDNKTVVLTTAVQEGGKEYTVSVDGKEVGKFKGVSAVIPTKIDITTQSVQGKVGQQAIVSADVGVKQAGIPVTFNVKANTIGTLNKDQVFEAVTDENGIATFSYTQYSAGTDSVVAYPTGAPTVRSLGYVFWGVDTILSIEEVTKGDTINNGANKTYKVTYKNPETGKAEANKTFNVSVLENIGVTADKLQNVTINGVEVSQLSNNTKTEAAQITTDSKGEATFTVSGTNSAVTPVVYGLNTTTGESTKTYKASSLQAAASKVTFGAVQAQYTIELTREGGEVAAIGATNGREYKVVVKDKEGKVAKNEIVNVAFNEDLDRVISTNTDAQFVVNKAYAGKQISVKTDSKGEATFVIGSNTVNAYATPIAWIDINTSNAKQGTLDEGEPKAVAPISYFQEAYLDGSAVKSYLPSDLTEAVKSFKGNETALFRAELVNQSGKNMPGTSIKSVTYTIYNTGANDIKVGSQVISPNRSYTVSYTEPNTDLYVNSIDNKTTSVKVVATGIARNTDGKDYAFTSKEAEATFTSTTSVGTEITESVVAVNKTHLEFSGKDPISLADAKFFGGNGSELIGVDAFIAELESYPAGVVVTYIQDKDGNKSFRVVRASSTSPKVNATTTLNTAKITKEAVAVTTATPATATITSAALGTQSLTVNGQTFTYNSAATGRDQYVYNSVSDLISKINAAGGVVTATADSADIKLVGKADGTQFTYRIGSLTPVTTENGVREADATKQEITFTFSTAVNVSVGAAVTVNGTTGTVASVESQKVVVTLDTAIPVGTPVTTFNVGANPLKSKLTDKVVTVTGVSVSN